MPKRAAANLSQESVEVRLGQVLGFMQLLWEVDHGLQQASRRMVSKLGITGPQRLVLRLVGQTPGITAGELADTLRLDPSTLTGILKRLESRGFVLRSTDPEDGRRLLLTLTDAGGVLASPRIGLIESAVRKALGKIRDDKLVAAQDVLETLARELHQMS